MHKLTLFYRLIPEPRLLTLEQLDYVFNEVETYDFAEHATEKLAYKLFVSNVNP